jgi:hypothetical protein
MPFAALPSHHGDRIVAVNLNAEAVAHAELLIRQGHFVHDLRGAWSEYKPSAEAENAFIDQHGLEEYGLWHLGINDNRSVGAKGYYEFPYGDLVNVHRSALISAENRAAEYGHHAIEAAAKDLRILVDRQGT